MFVHWGTKFISAFLLGSFFYGLTEATTPTGLDLNDARGAL